MTWQSAPLSSKAWTPPLSCTPRRSFLLFAHRVTAVWLSPCGAGCEGSLRSEAALVTAGTKARRRVGSGLHSGWSWRCPGVGLCADTPSAAGNLGRALGQCLSCRMATVAAGVSGQRENEYQGAGKPTVLPGTSGQAFSFLQAAFTSLTFLA